MRIDKRDKFNVAAAVSRRNLLTLLHKSYTPESAKTLTITGLDGSGDPCHFSLRAESDEDHYKDRPFPPGPVGCQVGVALQIAVDLLNQVEDALSSSPDPEATEHEREVLEKVANTIGWVATKVASRYMEVV